LTIESYVCTYIVRALSSAAVFSVAIVGLAVSDNNATGNNYKYKEVNRQFMVAFFGFTAFFEGVACLMYLLLWAKQRGKHDISAVNKADCQGTCFFILLRVVWAIGLSIFFLISFNDMQKGLPGDPYGDITRG
jgi:hypothetical protein